MRTLVNPLKHMNEFEIFRIFEKHTMYPTTLCSFWKNFSGHFARLTCNHSYGYAHCLIFHGANRTSDSLTDFIKYTPLSAFSCNMRVSREFQPMFATNVASPTNTCKSLCVLCASARKQDVKLPGQAGIPVISESTTAAR